MAKKKKKWIFGRFEEPEQPGASIFVWGILALILLETVIFAIPCGYMCVKKIRERTLAKRFGRFVRILGNRTSVSVRELARAENWTEDGVRGELRKMIDLGWFGPKAFLNAGEGSLIVPQESHRESEKNWVSTIRDVFREIRESDLFRGAAVEKKTETVRKKAEPARKAEQTPQPEVKPAAKAQEKTMRDTYIERLEQTLGELYTLNQQIEDEAVSTRIDRIGMLTAGIFRVVIQNPNREPDVRKFMNYYLPTTLKLLKSYDLLEDDRVQSANIIESRKKIENMLDKLIEAFEQLHDSLYSSDTLDLETDIEVLETMMAKDGLSRKGKMQMPSHG